MQRNLSAVTKERLAMRPNLGEHGVRISCAACKEKKLPGLRVDGKGVSAKGKINPGPDNWIVSALPDSDAWKLEQMITQLMPESGLRKSAET